MDYEELKRMIYRQNNNLGSRLSLTRIKGLEDYYSLAKRIYDMGSFVLANVGDCTVEYLENFCNLYQILDEAKIMNGAHPDVEATKEKIEAMLPRVSFEEGYLKDLYGYKTKDVTEDTESRRRMTGELQSKIRDLEFELEDCAIQYVMNKNKFQECGLEDELTELYERCVEYIKANVSNIKTDIDGNESLLGCSEVLEVNRRLADLLMRFMETKSKEKLTEYCESFDSILSTLEQKYENKEKATITVVK